MVVVASCASTTILREALSVTSVPAVLGGVAIAPGDIVVGDREGIAVVPRLEAKAVLSRLESVRSAERALEAKVREGLDMPDFAKAVLSSDKTRYLD